MNLDIVLSNLSDFRVAETKIQHSNKIYTQTSESICYKAYGSNRKAMNRNWSNQKANPALKTKTGTKLILQIDKIQ